MTIHRLVVAARDHGANLQFVFPHYDTLREQIQLEIYSRLAIGGAQAAYDKVIRHFPV